MTLSTRLDVHLWRKPRQPPESADTHLLNLATTRLRYRDTAPGSALPTVAILCDPPNMVEHYDAVIAAFGPDWRIVVIELPGFGFSHAKQASALEFIGTVDAVEQLLGALNCAQLVVAGPCVCGFVAVELARRAALPIHALVLMQTPDLDGMTTWTEGMDPKRRLRRPILGQLAMRATARKVTAFWYRFSTAKASDHRALDATAQRLLKQGAAYSLASMLQRWSTGPANGVRDLPVLAIWGQQDRSHAHTDPQCSSAHAKNVQIETFRHCGHFPDLEDPEHFASTVTDFLTALPH